MNEQTLKHNFIKLFEHEMDPFNDDDYKVLDILKKSEMYIEYTSIFTRIEWDTYIAILHIQTKLDNFYLLEKYKSKFKPISNKILGRNDSYIITDIELDLLIEHFQEIEFDELDKSKTLSKTIEDAEEFIRKGKYLSAIDRVHTTLHGYLRWRLDSMSIDYSESDTLMQLYSKLHNNLNITPESSDINEIIKTTIRSASAVINSINTARNKHSLSHPNTDIIGDKEAKLLIGLSKFIFDYIESTNDKKIF